MMSRSPLRILIAAAATLIAAPLAAQTASPPPPEGESGRLVVDVVGGVTAPMPIAVPVMPTPLAADTPAGSTAALGRQVQPCANRMVSPGPGANRIKVTISLRLDRDGSLAAPPRTIGETGLDSGNRRYLQRVKELAISAFTSCSPLRGLPPDLYAVRNGWNDFDMIYNLP